MYKYYVILILFASQLLQAQDTTSVRSLRVKENLAKEISTDSLLSLVIPPIDTLYAWAEANAISRFYDNEYERQLSQLHSTSWEWLNYIRLVGMYQWGVLAGSSDISNTNTPSYFVNSSTAQRYYNYGVSIAMPLDQLFDLKAKHKRQKLLMEQQKIQKERYFDDRKLLIVESYAKSQESLALLRVKSEALLLARSQYAMSKMDFANGVMDIQTLGRWQGSLSTATTEYEVVRSNLLMSVLKLEVLCCKKIINR